MRLVGPLALFVAVMVLGRADARRRNKVRANGKSAVCEYTKDSDWTECGPGVDVRQRVLRLAPGSPEDCAPTRNVTKPCRGNGGGGRKRKGKGRRRKEGKVKGCKYGRKSEWTDCGPGVTERHRERKLKAGSPDHCPPRRVITKPCRHANNNNNNKRRRLKKKGRGGKACKYMRGAWQPCDDITNKKKRELTLKKGDPKVCSAVRTIEKPCRRRAAFMGAKTSQCRYEALPWGECSSRTNTMTRVLRLKKGDPALCQPAKHLTRKCRKPCKFSKGEWSECDGQTGMKTRTDHLVKGDPALCEPTRVISRMCGKEDKCQYEVGNWSECDPGSQMRTRVKTLTGGDADKCQQEIRIQRPCVKPNGKEGCFLGKWGDYGPCQNGVMMKHRPVIAGGMACERKAVKTKPCP
ncbi:uncharacterized protein LOC143282678 isoform X1 [Babylonia areolata]|uniref:uncharacterized protein LOC143282678 isoform X1 n=1 Tax=Babylonia areolata TaxID=304850 RepID=UPI003FD3390A